MTCFGILDIYSPAIRRSETNQIRGVIVTLIRSTNKSIFLTVNMIHSIVKFHTIYSTYMYPFLIFHDENFTSSMRQYILSCVHKTNKTIQISFAAVNFRTNIKPNVRSPLEKSIGYRIMCRFWIYDVFYHPAIIHGHYDYLMRMDDDSYFFDVTKKDLFQYMESQKLDYIYRSFYGEPIRPMEPVLKRFNKTMLQYGCIYNNFFIIRLKWFYESKVVQSFLHELMKNDLILREYIGDGCVHAAMLEIDDQVKVEHVIDISYGHNYHVMSSGYERWSFDEFNRFSDEKEKSC